MQPNQPIIQDTTSENSTDKKQQIRLLAAAGAVILALLIIIATTIVRAISSSNEDNDTAEMPSHDTVIEEVIAEKYVLFQDYSFLQTQYGNELTNKILNQIRTVFLMESELASASLANNPGDDSPDNAYLAALRGVFYTNSYNTYSTDYFEFMLSDGRTYGVYYTASSQPIFYAVIVQRVEPATSEPPHLFINFLSDTSQIAYDRDLVIDGLKSWANAVGFSEFYLTTTDPY